MSRWEKLKEWLKSEKGDNLYYTNLFMELVLEKMKELEEEKSDE